MAPSAVSNARRLFVRALMYSLLQQIRFTSRALTTGEIDGKSLRFRFKFYVV